MKILSINNNFYRFFTPQTDSIKYQHSVSFGNKELTPFEQQMLGLKDVHCPICGVKMLPRDDWQHLAKDVEFIKKPKDFIQVLEDNEDSIRKPFKPILKTAKEIFAENPDIELGDFYKKLYFSAAADVKRNVSNAIIALKFAENTDDYIDSDKVLLEECKMRLKALNDAPKRVLYDEYKSIIKEIMSMLSSEQKWKLYETLKNPVKNSIMLRDGLAVNPNAPDPIRTSITLKNIFGHSVSRIRIVGLVNDGVTDNFNKILTCDDCGKGKRFYFTFFNSSDAGQKFSVYQSDIAKQILNGALTGNNLYPFKLEGYIKKLTKGNVESEKNDASIKALQQKNFHIAQSELDFVPVTYDGVPCSCCGKPTINHEHKLALYNEISRAKNLWQILDILERNEKIISKKNKFILENFAGILESNPVATQKEVVAELRKISYERIIKQFEENEKQLNTLLSNNALSESDVSKVKIFIKKVKEDFSNYDINNSFPFTKYNNLIRQTIGSCNSHLKTEMIMITKESVRNLCESQGVLFPPASVVAKLQSQMKPIAQNIINGSVATVDHLIPKSKNGENSIYNCTVMCKDCNFEKSYYSFYYWYKLHPGFKVNVQKYMDYIVNLINKGKLKDYSSYPKVFATRLQKLTDDREKIVLRFRLKKDDSVK